MSFLLEDVCDVLKKNASNILGNTLSDAAKGVQDTVKQLVKKAELQDDIANKYITFAGDEDLLYSSESYRDHFFHPFHTFLLGFLILSRLKLSKQDRIPFPLNDDFLKKWLLISLLHDITYAAETGPSSLAGYIKKKLGFDIQVSQNWTPIFEDTNNIRAIDKLSLRFESNEERRLIFLTWLNKQIGKCHDHGVLSAILLLKVANEWNLDEEMVNECSLAIALHNYHKALSGDGKLIEEGKLKSGESPAHSLGSLAIKDYPLAFLLAYCDTAQEWGRPSSKHTTKYIAYHDVPPVNKNEILIELDYDLNEFIKIKKITLSPKYTIHNSFNDLVEEEDEKFNKMRNTWKKSDEWNYSIELIGVYDGRTRAAQKRDLTE